MIFEHLGWPAIFWLSAIVGVLLIIAVAVVVPESSVRTRGKFDFLGAVMLSTALTAILLAISKGARWGGWTSELTLLMFVIGIVTLALWFPYELRVTQPMVDLRTSAKRPVLLTNVASILVGFSMYANNLSTTQQLQMPKISGYGFELGVMAAGLCMIPAGLAMVFFAPVSANITKRFGAKITLIVGGTVLALAYIARVFLTGSIALIIISAAVVSIGTAIAYSAMPMLIMRSVPITETASANGSIRCSAQSVLPRPARWLPPCSLRWSSRPGRARAFRRSTPSRTSSGWPPSPPWLLPLPLRSFLAAAQNRKRHFAR